MDDLLDVERVSKYFVAQAFSYFVKYVYTEQIVPRFGFHNLYFRQSQNEFPSFSVGSNKGNTGGMDSKITPLYAKLSTNTTV